MQKKSRKNDGSYYEQHRMLNQQFGVEEKLKQLKADLLMHFPDWEISPPNLSRPDDPSIFIRYNDLIRIQCMVKSRTDNVIVNILLQQNTKANRAEFVELGKMLGVQVVGKNAMHMKLPGWKKEIPKLHQLDDIIARLREAWRTLDKVYKA